MTINIRPTYGDGVQREHMEDTVASVDMHINEQTTIDMVKAERERVERQQRDWVDYACELRNRRNEVDEQINRLEQERSDLNSAMSVLRHACGVDDEDEWYGFDTPRVKPTSNR